MGLLNHLFGSKESIAKELIIDDNKRISLWNEHLANYPKREKLATRFNFKNVDGLLQDYAEISRILNKIEALISLDLINITNEEKTNDEILADLKRLKSNVEIENLTKATVLAEQKQPVILKLFHEIFNVLKAELHIIKLIKQKPSNLRALLLELFEIIFHREAMLYKLFREECFSEENRHMHPKIARIARAILLEKEVLAEIETDEEKFARVMVNQMAPGESIRRYRKLAEDIFYELAELAGAPISREEDITEGLKRMEEFIRNNELMYKLVKKLRPKYADAKIRGVILAFHNAYRLGHFIDLESQFAT